MFIMLISVIHAHNCPAKYRRFPDRKQTHYALVENSLRYGVHEMSEKLSIASAHARLKMTAYQKHQNHSLLARYISRTR